MSPEKKFRDEHNQANGKIHVKGPFDLNDVLSMKDIAELEKNVLVKSIIKNGLFLNRCGKTNL